MCFHILKRDGITSLHGIHEKLGKGEGESSGFMEQRGQGTSALGPNQICPASGAIKQYPVLQLCASDHASTHASTHASGAPIASEALPSPSWHLTDQQSFAFNSYN